MVHGSRLMAHTSRLVAQGQENWRISNQLMKELSDYILYVLCIPFSNVSKLQSSKVSKIYNMNNRFTNSTSFKICNFGKSGFEMSSCKVSKMQDSQSSNLTNSEILKVQIHNKHIMNKYIFPKLKAQTNHRSMLDFITLFILLRATQPNWFPP